MYDKNGLRRFHGAFEGGWSAGYYNTVGSKEGWTPRQWNSNKDSQKATNTIEDYVDDEDEHERDNRAEIVNVGPEILARWSDAKHGQKTAFEVFPETQKMYIGPGGIGYDSRLVESESQSSQSAQNGQKRLTMGSVVSGTKSISGITPGSGKKRPLVLHDEDDEELYPVTKSLPKLRKESEETRLNAKTPSIGMKHKFLTAKQRREVGTALVVKKGETSGPVAKSRTPKSRVATTCSDEKLPLPNFIVVHVTNPVFKQYGLDSTPVTDIALKSQVQNQVDSFLDSLQLSLTSNPYKSKLDSKFQLAGSTVEGPKGSTERTVVTEWEPSKLLCKRMGIRYDKVRVGGEEAQVNERGGFGKDKIEKMRGLFRES